MWCLFYIPLQNTLYFYCSSICSWIFRDTVLWKSTSSGIIQSSFPLANHEISFGCRMIFLLPQLPCDSCHWQIPLPFQWHHHLFSLSNFQVIYSEADFIPPHTGNLKHYLCSWYLLPNKRNRCFQRTGHLASKLSVFGLEDLPSRCVSLPWLTLEVTQAIYTVKDTATTQELCPNNLR